MKLLFDENLSPKLVALLASVDADSAHVRNVGLAGAADELIWEHAREHGYLIVSKDDDFRQRSFLEGAPPKILWLQVGNAGTAEIAQLLREHAPRIGIFGSEVESALLILSNVRRAV